MNYLQNKRRRERVLVMLKEALVYLVVIAVVASTVLQYQLVKMLDTVLQQDAVEQVEEYTPLTDPCTLNFINCAEASELETVVVTVEASVEASVQAEALRAYLISKGGAELAEYAEQIIELDQWQLAVAIAWKETHFCTRGVGASRNNCGGIKSWKTANTFKTYENVFDSVWDINYLLNKPRFVNMSVKELASTYCVDEANGGGECPNWADVVNSVKADLAFANT